MKKIISFLVLISLTITLNAQKFTRNFPEQTLLDALTPEKIKNVDAVIVLKEQNFVMGEGSISYRGSTISGTHTTHSRIIIAKLFNDAAISRYGSFEYTYEDFYPGEISTPYTLNVRVLKANKDIYVLPESEIKNIAAVETNDGKAIYRKLIYKIPNLEIGDVVQSEFTIKDYFSRVSGKVFYYSDYDPVLYSNLNLTLPADEDFNYYSFPETKIGQPSISQISNNFGAGKTYFWSVRSIGSVPSESYSIPFEDQSLITVFAFKKRGSYEVSTWDGLSKFYYEKYIDRDGLSFRNMKTMKIQEKQEKLNFSVVDTLYYQLRKYFNIAGSSSLYPGGGDISKVIDEASGDGSDIAYIFLKILDKWKIEAKPFLIRDKREGIFEMGVPTTAWFDRMGIWVTINGVNKYYDFDPDAPAKYETPWYLKGISIIGITPKFHVVGKIPESTSTEDNIYSESHVLTIDSDLKVTDSLEFYFHGIQATNYRSAFYRMELKELNESIQNLAKPSLLSSVDSFSYNNFFDNEKFNAKYVGESFVVPESVDEFITLRLKDKIFTAFRDRLFSANRKNHVVFQGPVQYELSWNVKFPDGYKLKTVFADKIYKGPGSSNSVFNFKDFGNHCTVTVLIKLPDTFVDLSSYQNLMAFLDKTINEIQKDIVLQKK